LGSSLFPCWNINRTICNLNVHCSGQHMWDTFATLRFIVVVNTRGIICSFSFWVSHYEICTSFWKINPRMCACFWVSTNGTQLHKPIYPLKVNDSVTNTMTRNKCNQTSWNEMNFLCNMTFIFAISIWKLS